MTPTDPIPDIETLLALALHSTGTPPCQPPQYIGVSGEKPRLLWECSPDAHKPDVAAILATPSGKVILDRLARAEAAVPDDPTYPEGLGSARPCFWCGAYLDAGQDHDPDCKWLAARPAR
jgi:hypothetical protein